MLLVDVDLRFDQDQKRACHEVLPQEVLYVRLDKQVKLLRRMQIPDHTSVARLAQSVEHETLNLRVVGSSPTLGAIFFSISFSFF